MKRTWYLIREALTNIRINRTSVTIGVMTTACTIACLGVFVLLYLNVQHVAGTLRDDLEVVVYVDSEATEKQLKGVQQRLSGEPAAAKVTLVTKVQALQEFHQQFPEESILLDGMGDNPLPASYVVRLAPQFQAPNAIETFVERVKGFPHVEHVRYSQEWIDTLALLVGYFEMGAVIIGSILAVATIAIIANTVRLSFYTRREEIEILRLIGATGSFIATPYVVEGALLGAMGGLLSLAFLKGAFEFFRMELEASGWIQGVDSVVVFLPHLVSFMLIVAGMLLGCLSSMFSIFGLMRSQNR
ncbi:MAG: permease-like cell division protein FtsX [Nitrospirota bacterium]|nr:permease-like cell division protein FtsX [Nitrospirota bacterium]